MASRIAILGALLFALSLAALGALELWCGAPLPGLHRLLQAFDPMLARAAGAAIAITSLGMIGGPLVRWSSLAAGALWGAFALCGVIAASLTPHDASGWVAAAECATFAAACFAHGGGSRAGIVLRLVFGATLVWFGIVHLTHRDLISSLIPEWMPARDYLPWLTGAVNVVAGLALLSGRYARWGALAIATMFGSWLPLVHAARIAADPGDLFEWTFALTAAALTGVALLTASRFAETRERG